MTEIARERSLDMLSSDLKPVAVEILARLVERSIHVLIVQTVRTPEEQAQAVATGHSGILHSKHLPRKLRGLIVGTGDDEKADAIDLCPFDVWRLAGPDTLAWAEYKSPAITEAWRAIGELGEAHGLRSGLRWSSPHDPGHLEWLFPGERYPDIPRTSAAFFSHGIATGGATT
jgi:hypothetical protein